MTRAYLVVASALDPVAARLRERWGTRPSTGMFVDGAPIRELGDRAYLLARNERHIHDENLDARLPPELRKADLPMVFPSIHRSAAGTPAFTVHPLGNVGPSADVGGRPGELVPGAPRWMASALRALAREAPAIGLGATFEATHHGPYLDQPAFFAEIGYADAGEPPPAAVAALDRVLLELEEDPADRVVIGVGGGHYVPHFTELALERSWAFAHLVSRHALARATPGYLDEVARKSPGAEGVLFARAADAADTTLARLGPRRRETEAPRRPVSPGGASRSSGT